MSAHARPHRYIGYRYPRLSRVAARGFLIGAGRALDLFSPASARMPISIVQQDEGAGLNSDAERLSEDLDVAIGRFEADNLRAIARAGSRCREPVA